MPTQPNIIFIHVDEMRYPMHLPPETPTPELFLQKYMPNLYNGLWKNGVKFKRYYTAAADCTPGRGTFVTGLYAYQTGLFLTRESTSDPYATTATQPPLQPQFETYGKLLRNPGAGYTAYETPYIGKWHLSDSYDSFESPGAATYLDDYGFKGLTLPDPLGMPSQGLGLAKPEYQGAPPPPGDPEIAAQAVEWLYARAKDTNNTKPFCLTVGFVNPHDKQFFWGGTQANQFNAVYNTIPDSTSPTGFEIPVMGFTQPIGPPPPPIIYKPNQTPTDWNWESAQNLKVFKPKLQTVFKDMFSYFWTGQISEDQSKSNFYAVQSSYAPTKHDAVAPYSYWYRALDYYTQMMSAVDVHIGQVINNIPDFPNDTVIVFCADHGEYASSHGLQGKGGSVYNECFNVPLIVYDKKQVYAQDPTHERDQLVSSVDLLRMLVTFGHAGSEAWLQDPVYAAMWGGDLRANLCAILKDRTQRGRDYVVFSTDEFFKLSPSASDNAPQHVVGVLTDQASGQAPAKTGFYHHWIQDTVDWNQGRPYQWEYYNYATDAGRKELDNQAAPATAQSFLLDTAMQKQLRLPLPDTANKPAYPNYRAARDAAIAAYWKYVDTADEPQHVSTAFA